MRAAKVPTTAAEAQVLLQDAVDARDRVLHRFDVGEIPLPDEREYAAAKDRVEYATHALAGLEAREKAEAENAAAEKARALRKKFRTEVGKNVEILVAAQKKLVEAATTLVTAAAFANERAGSIKQQVAQLRPADVSIDAKVPWLDEALKFGNFPIASVAAVPLIKAAVHEALSAVAKDLNHAEVEWLRSLDNGTAGAVTELLDIKERLTRVDRTAFEGKAEHMKPADAGPVATKRSA